MKETTQHRSRRVALPLLGGGALLGAAALMAYGSAAPNTDSATAAPSGDQSTGDKSTVAASSAAAPGAASQAAGQYHQSPYSGLMVRSVPAKKQASHSDATGLIYLKPGVPRSAFVPRGGLGRRDGRIVKGRSAAGGTILYTDPSSMPYATAQIKQNGSIVLHCEHDGKPHSMREHQAHQTAPSHSAAGPKRNSLPR